MINEKYSYKDFTDQTLLTVDVKELNNTEIVGSCFSQQAGPNTEIFPAKMLGVIFRGCNLDNVKISSGNTMYDCTNIMFKIQKDMQYWVVDKDGNVVEPLNKDLYEEFGISTKPVDIPAVDTCVLTTKIKEVEVK